MLCATVNPGTGAIDGPYLLLFDTEEWTLDRARSIGQAPIALVDAGSPTGQMGPHLA